MEGIKILERTVNSVSMNAAIDRATSTTATAAETGCGAAPPTTVFSSSSSSFYCNAASEASAAINSNVNGANNNLNKMTTQQPKQQLVLATAPRSLQSKLVAARKQQQQGDDGYPLCQYRKGFFDQFKLKSLFTSTLRVTVQQATLIVATFMSEQMEKDLKRNKLVDEGQLTRLEADQEAEEWENIEWTIRWKTFPLKLATALTKFHSVTMIMRLYETIVDKWLKVDTYTMDKLTMDPFKKSKRVVDTIEKKITYRDGQQHHESVRDHKMYVVKTMTETTFWANLLTFCADYSLHQALLCYGYYKYYQYQRQKRLDANTADTTSVEVDWGDGVVDDIDVDDVSKPSSGGGMGNKELVENFALNSIRLGTNRTLGLVCSAIGGGIGSIIWPGWGTIVVSAIGDNVAGIVLDDGYYKAWENLDEQKKKTKKIKKL